MHIYVWSKNVCGFVAELIAEKQTDECLIDFSGILLKNLSRFWSIRILNCPSYMTWRDCHNLLTEKNSNNITSKWHVIMTFVSFLFLFPMFHHFLWQNTLPPTFQACAWLLVCVENNAADNPEKKGMILVITVTCSLISSMSTSMSFRGGQETSAGMTMSIRR